MMNGGWFDIEDVNLDEGQVGIKRNLSYGSEKIVWDGERFYYYREGNDGFNIEKEISPHQIRHVTGLNEDKVRQFFNQRAKREMAKVRSHLRNVLAELEGRKEETIDSYDLQKILSDQFGWESPKELESQAALLDGPESCPVCDKPTEEARWMFSCDEGHHYTVRGEVTDAEIFFNNWVIAFKAIAEAEGLDMDKIKALFDKAI